MINKISIDIGKGKLPKFGYYTNRDKKDALILPMDSENVFRKIISKFRKSVI